MRERKKSLERLLAVKTQLHRLEEARLAEIETAEACKRREEQRAMLGFLDQAEAAEKDVTLAQTRVPPGCRGGARRRGAGGASRLAAEAGLLRRRARKRRARKAAEGDAAALAREEEKRAAVRYRRKDRGRRVRRQASRKPGRLIWSRRLGSDLMAISPASDLILDVARAADPGKAMATTRLSPAASGDAGGFRRRARTAFTTRRLPRDLSYQESGRCADGEADRPRARRRSVSKACC